MHWFRYIFLRSDPTAIFAVAGTGIRLVAINNTGSGVTACGDNA